MTERQLEMLNNDFRYLAGIVHSQTTDKTLLATKFRVSWPTMQRKVTNLLEAGIIVDKGDSYKINPDILATSLFIGIYSDGISINCIALNLAQETVDLSEVKQELGKIWNVINELQNKWWKNIRNYKKLFRQNSLKYWDFYC